MGKRELLLIVCFVIVGAVVYQATAPPPDPSRRGFSFSRIWEAARREVTGNRSTTEISRTASHPAPADITEVRIHGFLPEIEVLGEERADVSSVLRIHSAAYNDEEAKKYGEATQLVTDRAAASLVFSVKYPQGRETGRQRARLTLTVPSRLRVRIETRPNKLTLSNVAGVEANNLGGEASITKVAGRAAVTHRGGRITIDDVDALRFTGRGIECKLTNVRGDAALTVEGGECTAARIGGALELESRNAEMTVEGLEDTRGPVRVNAMGGLLRLKGVKSEARVDGRNTEVDVAMAAPAPVAIYTEGDDVALTPPAAGFKLDAVVIDGRIAPETAVQELGLKLEAGDGENRESRVSGAVKGGGPTITVRATRGNLTIRKPGDAPAAADDAPASNDKSRRRVIRER